MNIDVEKIGEIAVQSGEAILQIYHSEFEVSYKEDQSPLTAADKAAHEIIHSELKKLFPDIPLISEEGAQTPYELRSTWPRFWLVDPLDGTKEFIKRNDQFSVNIALIEGNNPVLGVIYDPVQETLYFASKWGGAHKLRKGSIEPIKAKENLSDEGLTLLESNSHRSKAPSDLLGNLKIREKINLGSSLKFCAVAEGRADAYVRQGPTWEWDTAAGQCLVEVAGGVVLGNDGSPFVYNKPSLKNPGFLVLSRPVQKQLQPGSHE